MNIKTTDWFRLRGKQRNLDEHILFNKDLNHSYVIDKAILALLTELGELANEWRGFKYWSEDTEAREADMLVEYVDNLHFILSLENYYEFKYRGIGSIRQATITDQFTTIFYAVASLASDKENKVAELLSIRAHFIGLGEMLGFTSEQVENAYNDKYKINFERQASGY